MDLTIFISLVVSLKMTQKAETCSRQYISSKCTILVVLFHDTGMHCINVLQNFARICMNLSVRENIIMEYSL